MKNFALIILCLFITASGYCQDDYLKKIGVNKEAVQAFCDTVLKKSIPLGNSPDKGINKNIQFGKGEFYYVNNDSCYIYDFPNFYTANKVSKLMFSDSIYVFKDTNNKPLGILVAGDGFGGTYYYLCATNTGKLGLFKDKDCISLNDLIISPNPDFFLTTNEFSSLLISKDWNKYYKIPTFQILWFPDNFRFLYNNCNVDCDTNSRIMKFDLTTWKSTFACKGVSPLFISNYKAIMYFRDSTINGLKKECIFQHDLNSGKSVLFYQIPDSMSYWINGDDYREPSRIKLGQINDSTLCFEIYLYKKSDDLNYDFCYIFYFNEMKKLIKIKRM